MHKYLTLAGKVSHRGEHKRCAHVGAVGVRSDGVIVMSHNGSAREDTIAPCPRSHAERRLIRKLDFGSTVYVARTRRDTGDFAMAKPCALCERALRAKGIVKAFYTIGPNEWGCIEF